MFRLAKVHGDAFVLSFFKNVGARPAAATTYDAVDNFVIAASATVNANLSNVFTSLWRFPLSANATLLLSQLYGAR
jgi:hypothetical protein